MKTINDDLAAALRTVNAPGDFYAAGSGTLALPSLHVNPVGRIALPLLQAQAEQLIATAERAPFGRGSDTLIDTAVRRTWQIGAERVQLQGEGWLRWLIQITARAATGLGVTGGVAPELYKLLVYDTGSFFTPHRDTEKSPGMFATLLIALPSLHTGGELLVRHKGREVRLDLHAQDPGEAAFAAFYADCTHEVLPVTSGNRLVLVFNLVRSTAGPLPQPPDHRRATDAVAGLLKRWSNSKPAADLSPAHPTEATATGPEKLLYPLDHAYTPAELSFGTLKGADAAAAAVLITAAQRAGCDLHLALLRIEETGSAEYSGASLQRGRWGGDDDNDGLEVGEVMDRSVTLNHWGRPDGHPAAWGDLPVDDDEICPQGALDDLEPDDQSFYEATGNEGASFERSYQLAALVLWPVHRRLAVLNQAGLSVTLPYLSDLVERWETGGAGQRADLWQEAQTLSGHMLDTWPRYAGLPNTPEPSAFGKLLALLARLNGQQRIEQCLSLLAEHGTWSAADNPALLQALKQLGPARAGAALAQLFAAQAAAHFTLCAGLLHAAAQQTGLCATLREAARALVLALPGDASEQHPRPWSWRAPTIEPAFVADLMSALWLIDTPLAEQAATHLLAWPARYGLDAVLLPALRSLAEDPAARPAIGQRPSGRSLWAACLGHLQARCAEPLEPPADWARPGTLTCRCQHCQALARFLNDPADKTWLFKANETERSHVLATTRASHCDLDCTTDKRGRPYSLVCTKNQASYQRRADQRAQDLKDLAWLV